jgi:signal transduction histidine kinase
MNFVSKPHVVLAPLVVNGELTGILTFGSDSALPDDFDEVLAILATQVSMWLEAQQTDSLLREKARERVRLLRNLVIAQEDERKLIAGDIHDDSIQEMSAVAIRLGMLRKHLSDAGALETLTKVEGSVTSSIGRLRSLMFRLRPPSLDEGGLAPALREQLSATAEECSFKWELTSDVIVEPAIEVRVPAFRIAQEAIANVRKHAGAKNVSINISTRGGGLLVKVRDDGVGFSSDPRRQEVGHLGVTSMRERAEICGGKYRLTSAPGYGTTVEFWIPESLNQQEATR